YPLFQLGITQPLFGSRDAAGLLLTLPIVGYSSIRCLGEHLGFRPSRLWLVATLLLMAVTPLLSDPFVGTPIGGPLVAAFALAALTAQVVHPLLRWRRGTAPPNSLVIMGAYIVFIA